MYGLLSIRYNYLSCGAKPGMSFTNYSAERIQETLCHVTAELGLELREQQKIIVHTATLSSCPDEGSKGFGGCDCPSRRTVDNISRYYKPCAFNILTSTR